MKSLIILILAALAAQVVHAQGPVNFIYDQQTQTNDPNFSSPVGWVMQNIAAPWGQSFTPTLSAIDFVRFNLNDAYPLNGQGATVYINLRSDSIGGTIIATSGAVTMPNGFRGNPNFFFTTSVALIPGATYYLEPVVTPGSDPWNILWGEYHYPGGSFYANGVALQHFDLSFREGIVVPEPSTSALLLLGAALFLRKVRRRCVPLETLRS